MQKTNNKTGLRFGSLVIIDYPSNKNATIKCRCDCGDERSYPKSILKPSRKSPLMCPMCAGHDCEICGSRIAYKGRQRSATCSAKCSKTRASNLEKARYQKIKNTENFKIAYKKRCELHKTRMSEDPDYAANFRKNAALRTAKFKSKLSMDKLMQIKMRNRRLMQIRDAIRDSQEITRNEKLTYQKKYYLERRNKSALIVAIIKTKTP